MKTKQAKSNKKSASEYPKLVRDKIPEIIEKEGRKVNLKILKNDSEYQKYLIKKIGEEVDEFSKAKGRKNLSEEMADVLEIVDALIKLNNLKTSEIKKIQKKKAKKRGAFKDRILMLKK